MVAPFVRRRRMLAKEALVQDLKWESQIGFSLECHLVPAKAKKE